MSTHKKSSKKILGIGATATAAVLIGGGVAVAYWTTSGSGTGTATAGNVSTLTVAQGGAAITGLYPGGPTATRDVSVTNPGSSAVQVSSLSASPASTSAGAGCVAADNFTAVADAISPTTINPGATVTFPGAVTVGMTETGVNQDGCKGVTLTINYTVG